MNKSIHFCVISVAFIIIVLQVCFKSILLPYYASLLCTLVVKSLFMTELNSFLRGHIILKRTLSPSVSGPRGTFYSSVVCPRRHMTLGYSVRGDSSRGWGWGGGGL